MVDTSQTVVNVRTDAITIRGDGHEVCQDFSLAGPDRIAVSDGCSGSPMTQIGATLLCTAAMTRRFDREVYAYEAIVGTFDAAHAAAMGLNNNKFLPLDMESPNCMDATVLLARYDRDRGVVAVHGEGDGAVIVERRDGRKSMYLFHFPSGYPAYPSYRVSMARRQQIDGINHGVVVRSTYEIVPGDPVVATLVESAEISSQWSLSFTPGDIKTLTISTDGIQSFEGPNLETAQVVAGLTGFKSMAGVFVRRRVKWFIREVHKHGGTHADDLSVASMTFE